MDEVKFQKGLVAAILTSSLFISFVQGGVAGGKAFQHSWGTSVSTLRTDGATDLSVTFDVTPAEYSDGNPPAKLLYYALQPNETIEATLRSYRTTPFPAGWLSMPSQYEAANDSSMIVPVFDKNSNDKLLSTLPLQPGIRVAGYGWFRNYYLARIEITPYYADPQRKSVLYSSRAEITVKRYGTRSATARQKAKYDPQFESTLRDLIVNFDEAQPYLSSTWNDTTGGWFNTSSQYAKLGIATDGIYRIDYGTMKAMFPSLGDPAKVRVIHDGTEVPIFVLDANSNGIFDPADYVEFPALKNYTGLHRKISVDVEEYHDYLNRYTDTSMYWITFGDIAGKKIATNPGVAALPDTLKSYTAFLHIEENGAVGNQFCGDLQSGQDPRYTSGDIWPWNFMDIKDSRKTISQTFTATDIDPAADSVTLYSKFMSWGAEGLSSIVHVVSIRLNDTTDLATASLHKFDMAVLKGRAPSSKLVEGTNTMSIDSKPTASTTINVCLYDWFEAEYPRKLKAVNDSLIFEFKWLTDRKLRTVQISNLSSNSIVVYKMLPTVEKISNVSYSSSAPFTLTFTDTVGPDEKYFLAGSAKILSPVVKEVKQFAGLRSSKPQADYIVITHSKFKAEAESYRQYISTSRLLTTRLVDVQDIFDEYGFGYPTPESIRDYLRSTMSEPGTPPSFLFLIGDATYDYKFYEGRFTAQNYVPSFGYPVSDPSLVVWDDIGFQPQMFVGRLPVNNVGEVTQYLDRVKAYKAFPNDDWNKRYLFFTGGDPASFGQIDRLKATQDSILNTLVKPVPIGGLATHFYKTITPHSDFGPYTIDQIRDAISAGGIFTSYIGHSGTETWDNGIVDPSQLQNNRGRFGLVTDLGCSTGKFAEPQIKSFSELFVLGPNSSAIAYISNSALGFEETSKPLAVSFYAKILRDSVITIGKAHLLGKLGLANNGLSLVNRVMLYTNTLIGDPSINLAVPFTPNLVEKPSLMYPSDPFPTDQPDSTDVVVIVANFGSVTKDSVDVKIDHVYQSQLMRTVIYRRPMPLLYDTLHFMIATRSRSGEHLISVTVDPQNKIKEISEQDNSATVSLLIASSDFKIVQPMSSNISSVSQLVLLNPTTVGQDTSRFVLLQIDTVQTFATPKEFTSPLGTVTTSFDISALAKTKRYWWRAKGQQSTHEWTTGTFYLGASAQQTIGQVDSAGWSVNTFANTEYLTNTGTRLKKSSVALRVISAGALDGSLGVIEVNGQNTVPNSNSAGHAVAVLDPLTDTVITARNFDTYNIPSQVADLAAFIDSVPNGYPVAAVVIDEGSHNFSGSAAAKNAYRSIGSAYIDQLGENYSWAIIGRKGASIGSVPEAIHAPQSGKVILDTVLTRVASSGSVTTPMVGPVGSWKQLSVSNTKPPGVVLTTSVLAARKDGGIDTLVSVSTDSLINLNAISPKKYSRVQLFYSFTANSTLQSPTIPQWGIAVTPPVELAVSPRSVSLSHATLQEGEIDTVKIKVFNVGTSGADSVVVQLSTNDGGPYRVLQTFSPFALAGGDSMTLQALYDSRAKRGSHSFLIQVDPNNTLNDLYTSNNSVTVPYVVTSDTLRPSFEVTFDNQRVVDGDYVRATPLVVFQLRDVNGTPITQNDTSIVHIEVDNKPLYYLGNSAVQFATGTPPLLAEIRWTPTLSEGEHLIRYFARDAAGNSSDTTYLFVQVASKLEITNVFNIPNPFGEKGTTFTFTLSGLDDPQSAHIKIYTVAGRLIHDLDVSSRVHIGINGYTNSSDNLYWNGRDKDGNEIANGVYLYRVIITGSGQQTTATQKLVKMR